MSRGISRAVPHEIHIGSKPQSHSIPTDDHHILNHDGRHNSISHNASPIYPDNISTSSVKSHSTPLFSPMIASNATSNATSPAPYHLYTQVNNQNPNKITTSSGYERRKNMNKSLLRKELRHHYLHSMNDEHDIDENINTTPVRKRNESEALDFDTNDKAFDTEPDDDENENYDDIDDEDKQNNIVLNVSKFKRNKKRLNQDHSNKARRSISHESNQSNSSRKDVMNDENENNAKKNKEAIINILKPPTPRDQNDVDMNITASTKPMVM